jgi:hypothetical protein
MEIFREQAPRILVLPQQITSLFARKSAHSLEKNEKPACGRALVVSSVDPRA